MNSNEGQKIGMAWEKRNDRASDKTVTFGLKEG
jgi:hypothetical protein